MEAMLPDLDDVPDELDGELAGADDALDDAPDILDDLAFDAAYEIPAGEMPTAERTAAVFAVMGVADPDAAAAPSAALWNPYRREMGPAPLWPPRPPAGRSVV